MGKAAKQMKASVHLPRIGVGSQGIDNHLSKFMSSFFNSIKGFNWYGTEKLIKKYLSSNNIPTYIYYFKRDGATTSNKRTHEQSHGDHDRLSHKSR